MHRRGVGAGAIAKKKLAEAKYKERGTVLAEDQLAQADIQRGETERKIFRPMIHSPSERNGPILCRSEARSLFWVSHAGAGSQSFWAVLDCFPRPQAGSWKGSGAAGIRTGAHMGSRACKMSKQLDMFKTNLEEFASKHKQEIRKNPEFRVQFQDMCATIGVDPLASGKGFWSEMLGVGDFYYELGVQIIEVCLALKHRNGGLITLEELHQQVLKGRGKFAQDVSQDDLIRAIKKLKALGTGFGIIPVGGTYLIQSVPAELNMDHTVVLQLAEKNGYVTVSEIKASLKWETERACQVLEHLLKEGLAWLDLQAPGEAHYWLPALFTDLYSQEITAEEAREALP